VLRPAGQPSPQTAHDESGGTTQPGDPATDTGRQAVPERGRLRASGVGDIDGDIRGLAERRQALCRLRR